MNNENISYWDAPGNPCDEKDIEIERSKKLIRLLNSGKLDYTSLVECKKQDASETIVIDVHVELSSERVNDIWDIERIAIIFSLKDDFYPEILALRKDFPINVPHLNLRTEQRPASLCLFDEPFSEIKESLTAINLIERIRQWLSRTSIDALHDDDQPLEPFIQEEGAIIIPKDWISNIKDNILPIYPSGKNRNKFQVLRIKNFMNHLNNFPISVGISLSSSPSKHCAIRQRPKSLLNLHEILKEVDVNILDELKYRIMKWHNNLKPEKKTHKVIIPKEFKQFEDNTYNSSNENYSNILELSLIIFINFPRVVKDKKYNEIKAFWIPHTLRELADKLNIAIQENNYMTPILGQKDFSKCNELNTFPLIVYNEFDRDIAVISSGIKSDSKSILLIGAGAIGSQIFINLIRSGFGKWTIVDDDVLFPHNMARHGLSDMDVGGSKAKKLAEFGKQLIEDADSFKAIQADILHPTEELMTVINEADVILDCSTSIEVARYISNNLTTDSKKISLFLNPDGKDLVIISEGDKRSPRLDHLEIQYYRAIYKNEKLVNHLPDPSKHRYGLSCRDVSTIIPQDYVGLNAALASMAFRNALESNNPEIHIWRYSEKDQSVGSYPIEVHPTKTFNIGEWQVVIDKEFIDIIFYLRKERLPNETGGIIIGSINRIDKIIYLSFPLHAPEDSIEMPNSFIRGCQNLQSEHMKIRNITLDRLQYVGEWHSHPDSCRISPSADDLILLDTIQDETFVEEFPATIIIVSKNKLAIHLSKNDKCSISSVWD